MGICITEYQKRESLTERSKDGPAQIRDRILVCVCIKYPWPGPEKKPIKVLKETAKQT